MTESRLTSRVLKLARRLLPDAYIVKHSDRATAGVLDVSLTHRRQVLWVEFKGVKTRLTPAQLRTLAKLGRASIVARATAESPARWNVFDHNQSFVVGPLDDGELVDYLEGRLCQ